MKISTAESGGENVERTLLKQNLLAWGNLVTQTILVIYFAVFMEWLYQVTKPSFMDFMPWIARFGIPMSSGLLLMLFTLPVFLVLFLAGVLVGRSRFWK